MAATYLLFAGHNNPGGGFAAGLVVGAVATLRSLSGLPQPFRAQPLVAGGLAIVAVVAVLPMLWGDPLLDQSVISIDVPVLGTIKSGSALPFDIGVAAIVVGLVISLLSGLTDTTPKATEQ
ncbi:MAG: MnhB domain-containing protein [Acidimicrobiales bacterium]